MYGNGPINAFQPKCVEFIIIIITKFIIIIIITFFFFVFIFIIMIIYVIIILDCRALQVSCSRPALQYAALQTAAQATLQDTSNDA